MVLAIGAGKALVERIKVLDHSNAPFSDQLRDASDLINFNLTNGERSLSYQITNDPTPSRHNPKDEWTLRWLLKRLHTESLTVESPSVRSEAWMLLGKLVTKLPVKTLARLLQASSLTSIMLRVLEWLNTELKVNMKAKNECDQLGAKQECKSSVPLPEGAESNATRKRKREGETGVDSFDRNGQLDPEHVFLVLISISSALKALQTKISRNSIGNLAFATHRVELVLQCSIEDAARILGNVCEIASQHAENPFKNIAMHNIFEAAIEPFVQLWRVRKPRQQDDDTLSEARPVAKFCLAPISRLWHLLKPDSRAQDILQALVISNCLQPSLKDGMLRTKGTKSERSHFRVISEALVSNIFQLARNDRESVDMENLSSESGNGADKSTQDFQRAGQAIPTIFRFAIYAAFAEKRKLGYKETLWAEEMFKALAGPLGFDFGEPPRSTVTSLGLDLLHDMLLGFQACNSSPGSAIIEIILLDFCGLSGPTIDQAVWKFAKLCINLECKVVLDSELNIDAKKEARPILRPLLNALAMSPGQLGGDQSENERSETMQGDLLISILNAFVRARALPSFIDVWEEQIVIQIKDLASLYDRNINETLWEGAKLYQEVLKKLKSITTPAQRVALLEKRLKFLQLHNFLANNFEQQYAALLIASCLYDAMGSQNSPDVLLQTALSFRSLLASPLIYSSFPSRYKHALWRPVANSYLTCPPRRSAEEETALLKNLSTLAAETVIELISSSHAGVHEYENGLSALAFLADTWPLCTSFNDDDRSCLSKSLELVFSTIIASLEGFHSSPSRSAAAMKQRWLGQKYCISSAPQFLVACCYGLINHAPVLNVLNDASASRFAEEVCNCALNEFLSSPEEQVSPSASSNTSIGWLLLWNTLRNSEAASEESAMARATRRVLLHIIQEENLQISGDSFQGSYQNRGAFALQSIQELQVENFPKDDRSKLANIVLRRLREGNSHRMAQQSFLYLLLRLSKNINKSMDMATHTDWLLEVALQADTVHGWACEEVPLWQRLIRNIAMHNIQDPQKEENYLGMLDFRLHISKAIEEFDKQQPQITLSVAIASAMICSRTAKEASFVLVDDSKQNEFVRLQIQRLAFLRRKEAYVDQEFVILLEILALLGDLLASLPLEILQEDFHWESRSDTAPARAQSPRAFFEGLEIEICQEGAKLISTEAGVKASRDPLAQALMSVREILCHMATKMQVPHEGQLVRPDELNFFRAPDNLHKWIAKLMKRFSASSPEQKAAALCELTQKENSPDLHPNMLHLLRRLVGSPFALEERIGATKTALGFVFMRLLDSSRKETRLNTTVAKLSILNTILSENPWVTIQHHIDSTISLVAILTSLSSALAPGGPVRKTYRHLINLLRTILTFHRQKIGGRYHLVVDALNGLLRCLYKPYEATEHFPQPDWIKASFVNPKLISTHPSATDKKPKFSFPPDRPDLDIIGSEEASSLSRLLTSICEPQPSALKAIKAKNLQSNTGHGAKPVLLNDPTKKAKALAGQHLQYLVMEYCVLQLQARLEPEAQKALLEPGIYSVLNAMSASVRQGCGEALDRQGKEIYRELIRGWRTYEGKGIEE